MLPIMHPPHSIPLSQSNFSWKPRQRHVKQAVRQTFASPSILSGSFNIDPPAVHSRDDHLGGGDVDRGVAGAGAGADKEAGGPGMTIPRVDAEGLDAVYAGLVGLGSRVWNELLSSIDEVGHRYTC